MALNNRQLQAVELLVYTNKLKQEIAEEVGVYSGLWPESCARNSL